MARRRYMTLLDSLVTVASWGVVVFLLGVPVATLGAGCVALFTGSEGGFEDFMSSGRKGMRAKTTPWADGPPVLRAITNGEYVHGDRVEALIANHPPDLLLVGRSGGLVCCYDGDPAVGVRGVAVIAENNRLTVGWVVTEQGKRGLDDPFARLPLVVVRTEAELCPECPAFYQLEYRRSLLAVTGGGGVVFERE